MNEPAYLFERVEDRLIFSFESLSATKTIHKLIEFRLLDSSLELYNLALVDVLQDGTASDLTVSNNQDMPKVLATVFQTIVYFFDKHPNAKILIQGSTKTRTRLYQMAIVKYLEELERSFRIWGFIGTDVERFGKGKNYDSFIISRQ